MERRNPIQHRMTRRAAAHDYTQPGLYHITLHVAEGLGQPLGAVVGNLSAPDGSAEAPRTALTPAGQMVEHELLTAIHARYPMINVQDYVIMPEHLHFLLEVQDAIISQHGKHLPLGQVIAGFKKGCNKRYWAMTRGDGGNAGEQTGSTSGIAGGLAGIAGGQTAAHTSATWQEGLDGQKAGIAGREGAAGSVPSGLPAGYKVPSSGTTERQPLFSPGYCDVMPVDARQLATQRSYIAGNPRSRLLRMSNRALLTVQRGSITTALTPTALRGFLQRECPPHLATPEALDAIENQLLIADGKRFVACDTFGNHALLTEHRSLPVVCHRRDARRFAEQKQRCLEEAVRGAVLISACISPKERDIMYEAESHGFPVVLIHDNGFTDRYHPSADRLALCRADRLLLATPWHYLYRGKEDKVSVPFCKAMNCVVQALCKTKDSWWQATTNS